MVGKVLVALGLVVMVIAMTRSTSTAAFIIGMPAGSMLVIGGQLWWLEARR